MIKKTITYKDYEGNTRTEDHYFNLSRAEMIELEYSFKGGFTKTLEKIAATQEPTEIFPMVKDLIVKSYGVKSPDGKRFIKTQEYIDEFVQSEAFSELMVELLSDDKKAAEFMNGLLNNPTMSELESAKGKANVSALPGPKA